MFLVESKALDIHLCHVFVYSIASIKCKFIELTDFSY